MKKNFIRFLSTALMLALVVSLAGCKPSDAGNSTTIQGGGNAEGKLFAEPTDISIVISSHVSWPFNENWVILKYITEATNANLKITTLPSAEQATKLNLMMASPETLPDLLHTFTKKTVDDYAYSGAYLAYDDHMDLMPNFQKFWATVPEAEREEIFSQRTCADGKMYSAPSYGTHTVNGLRTWMYRQDIFEKHNLQVPTTADEMFEVAKKLKELYPDSYPIAFRDGWNKIQEWGASWQPYLSPGAYYDYTDSTWKYGGTEPVMKDFVEYFIKLKDNGLVPPDYITMETKTWEELMSTDRGFMTLDYIVRIDFFNKPNRMENPDYTLALMAPPKPDTPKGDHKLTKSNLDFNGYCVCNTGKTKNEENAFRFVDWMYSDEAAELLSWGKEGETYDVVDGKKQFILEGEEEPQNKYGFATYGMFQRLYTESNEALYTDEQVEACHEVLQYLEPNSYPLLWLSLDEDEQREASQINDSLNAYNSENLTKFLLGQRPMSEWDAFQKGFENLQVDDLLEIYTVALNRVLKK